MATKNKLLRVTLIKSTNKKLPSHKASVKCLGLSAIGQTVEVIDTPEIRGMLNKINYLLKVEEK
ncbi:MAG: 50S ribosomal protein L30 [Gammaproteobacteria bacterium]|nr:50S ribosomal protein L30 [Gammaproteobacteria bacterium]